MVLSQLFVLVQNQRSIYRFRLTWSLHFNLIDTPDTYSININVMLPVEGIRVAVDGTRQLKIIMGLVATKPGTKPVFRVSDKVKFKPVSSATGTSQKMEISPVASLHMIISTKRITKALIRLRGGLRLCCSLNPRRQLGFLALGPYGS